LDKKKEFIAQSVLFKNMSSRTRETLMQSLTVEKLQRGQDIMVQGE
jgi:signal-transduction protein with cAMP-binding, CBS, and nucleotidyltransferase domain